MTRRRPSPALLLIAALTGTVACAADPVQEALDRGTAALRTGDVEVAVAALTQCATLAPQDARCVWELGWAHWRRSDWQAAVDAWRTVERLDPAWPDLHKWLDQALSHAEAVASFRASAARAPATVGARASTGRTVRLRFAGDVMMGADYPEPELPPDDGAHLLDGVAPLLRDADLTFVNLEGPLCDSGETKKCRPDSTVCYAFRTPTRYGRYVKDVGVDLASLANNHSGDFGETCRAETQQTLDRLGIAWSGPPGSIARVEAGGLKIALVAFHTSAATNDVNDHDAADALVRRADEDADLVIVSFHGGAEGSKALHVPNGEEVFHDENRGDLRTFARRVVAAGADLVIGHGPHVVRGMELLDGHLVAYSLGNFATYGRFNLSGFLGKGLVLEVVLDADGKLVTGKILPTRQVGEGVPEVDPDAVAIDLIRTLSQQDFPGTAPEIGRDGSIGGR